MCETNENSTIDDQVQQLIAESTGEKRVSLVSLDAALNAFVALVRKSKLEDTEDVSDDDIKGSLIEGIRIAAQLTNLLNTMLDDSATCMAVFLAWAACAYAACRESGGVQDDFLDLVKVLDPAIAHAGTEEQQ